MNIESDCSSFSDSLESGYNTISDDLLNTTLSYQGNEEETSLMKVAESLPKSDQSVQDISEFIPLMPDELKNDLIDVLIICHPSDKDDAEVFKEEILSLKFKAEVFDCSVVNSEQLNDLYQRSFLYFLYVTVEFCGCTETLFKSHLSLAETLNDKNKKYNIVPVYVCEEKKINLDMTLRYLNPIRYYRKNRDKKTVEKILERKRRDILKREIDLEERRKKYFHENEDQLRLLHNKEKTHHLNIKSNTNVKDDISEETTLTVTVSNTNNKKELYSHSLCDMPCKAPNQPISESCAENHNKTSPIVDGNKSQATVINKTKNVYNNFTINNLQTLTVEDNNVSNDAFFNEGKQKP